MCCASPQALSTLAWGCARANHYDEEMFDKVAAWVAANWEHIPAFDLGNFAWGLGKAYGEHGVLSKGCMLAEDERRPAILRFINAMPIRLQVGHHANSTCLPSLLLGWCQRSR